MADGHLTDVLDNSVYSSVVSLQGLHMLLFIAKLNGIVIWGTATGNAYIKALTFEYVYIVAGPENGMLEGHHLLIPKALYGLWSSGAR